MGIVKRYVLNQQLSEEELEKIAVHIYFAKQIKSREVVTKDNVDDIVNQAMVMFLLKFLKIAPYLRNLILIY